RNHCLATAGTPKPCEHGTCSHGESVTPTCVCDTGYALEASACVRNACIPLANEAAACDAHATCAYLGGGQVQCACTFGYDGDGKTCTRNACVPLNGGPNPCGANQSCASVAGKASCSCQANYADCNATAADGCEVQLTTDASNCGSCGFACAPKLACHVGACDARATSLSLSYSGSWAVMPDNSIGGWGNNAGSAAPTLSAAWGHATQLSGNFTQTCAIRPSGNTVSCWGGNASGELGITDTAAVAVDLNIASVHSVSAGYTYSCAAAGAAGNVFCWGAGDAGVLGDAASHARTPVPYLANSPVATVSGAVTVAAGSKLACALTAAGAISCWGADDTGAAFLAESVRAGWSNDHPAIGNATELCVGYGHGCAVLSNHTVVCWAVVTKDTTVALAAGGLTASVLRDQASTISVANVTHVACGQYHTCVSTSAGEVYCWGNNTNGQLGSGDTNSSSTPVKTLNSSALAGNDGVRTVYSGSVANHTCEQTRSGKVYCWGWNYYGQIGAVAANPVLTPVEITGWP
ncbi:MAG TPA: EGF domain-containing protein, partial [Polyangiales bacterium]